MKNHFKQLSLGIGVLAFILGMAIIPTNNGVTAFHTDDELRYFEMRMGATMTIDSSQYFATSSLCSGCHGFDEDGFAMVDEYGQDVNIHDDWRSSMMANSAKDPFWRAKVSHEITVNPSHSLDIQDKCTTCHAPMGNYTAHYNGADHYTMADLLVDTIGLDGVSCGACHQMSADNLGNTFSGIMNFDTNRVMYGPYPFPFAPPMTNFVGFEPVHSAHILDAGACASCHSLVTETVDLTGEYTGETFVEQATYHEWLNSSYNVDSVSCQACHMPQIFDSIVISDNYIFLEGRTPYGLHELVGANTMMLKLMRENRLELGIDAEEEHFDETIAATLRMLQQQTLDLDIELLDQDNDSLFFKLDLFNKAGHKFPSGYPSRRAFVQFLLIDTEGDTIFQSGTMDDNFEVIGQDPNFEPHYQVINDENQVQIYEIVTGDVENNFTTLLERAAVALKDNRLPPLGFTTTHEVYDTTVIAGTALNDPDFNIENGVEGSARDLIQYHISRADYMGGYAQAQAHVYYQSLPPRWLAPMFEESTPEIDAFRTMYEQADRSPVLIASVSIDSILVPTLVGTSNPAIAVAVNVYPNPTADGWVNVELPAGAKLESVRIIDLNGRLLGTAKDLKFELPKTTGTYLLEIRTSVGVVTKRVIRE